MRPNPQETADLVTFTEEILNGKLHFLCSGRVLYTLLNAPAPLFIINVQYISTESLFKGLMHLILGQYSNLSTRAVVATNHLHYQNPLLPFVAKLSPIAAGIFCHLVSRHQP